MHVTTQMFRWSSAVCVGALLALGACKSSSTQTTSATNETKSTASAMPTGGADKATLTQEATASAQVIAVDKTARTVTLQREDGTMMQVRAGDAVRNFDQIAAGDTLRVHYKQTLSATKAGADSSDRGHVALAAARAPEGAKPAAGIGVGMRAVVKIESLDLAHDIVVGSLASGELVAHRLATPEGRAFAKTLKVGDRVELTYSEAAAIAIDKM